MPALGPRETEPDAWIDWLKEATKLLLRRPSVLLTWLVFCLALFFIAFQAAWQPVRTASLLCLMPLMLMVFIRFAWCADYSRPARLVDVMPTNRDCGVAIGIGVVMLVLMTAFDSVLGALVVGFNELVTNLGFYQPILADGTGARAPLRNAILGPVLVIGLVLGFAISVCLVLMLAFGWWFALPMLVLHQSPLSPSVLMSARAYQLNPIPMVGLAGVLLIGVGLIGVSLGWLALILAPFHGALLYTSYRDVFLGRSVSEAVVEMDGAGREAKSNDSMA